MDGLLPCGSVDDDRSHRTDAPRRGPKSLDEQEEPPREALGRGATSHSARPGMRPTGAGNDRNAFSSGMDGTRSPGVQAVDRSHSVAVTKNVAAAATGCSQPPGRSRPDVKACRNQAVPRGQRVPAPVRRFALWPFGPFQVELFPLRQPLPLPLQAKRPVSRRLDERARLIDQGTRRHLSRGSRASVVQGGRAYWTGASPALQRSARRGLRSIRA
jgi:hypothetical protein